MTENNTITAVNQLAIDHDYYCADGNYYSNDSGQSWENMCEYLDAMESSDIDMNLVFRWDIRENNGSYSANIYIMHQRKGIFAPHHVKKITDDDVPRFVEYLKNHKNKLDKIWQPII